MSKLFLTALSAAFLFPIAASAQVSNLRFCAVEGQICHIQREDVVFYGAQGAYVVKVGRSFPSREFVCDSKVFEDPIPSQTKACYLLNTAVAIQPCQADRCDFLGYLGDGIVILNSARGTYAVSAPSGSRCHGKMIPAFDLGVVRCEWFSQSLEHLERDRQQAKTGDLTRRRSEVITVSGGVATMGGVGISNAKIRIINRATGAEVSGQVDTQGRYFAGHGFPPGDYTFAVSAPGFAPRDFQFSFQQAGHLEIGLLQLENLTPPK